MILKNPNQCPGRKVGAFSFGVGDDWEDEMIQRKNPPCLGMADFELLRGGGSEPAFATGDVGVDELLIGLGEIDDSFDESDNSEEPASHEADDQLDDAFLAITKDKLVGTGPSKKDAE